MEFFFILLACVAAISFHFFTRKEPAKLNETQKINRETNISVGGVVLIAILLIAALFSIYLKYEVMQYYFIALIFLMFELLILAKIKRAKILGIIFLVSSAAGFLYLEEIWEASFSKIFYGYSLLLIMLNIMHIRIKTKRP